LKRAFLWVLVATTLLLPFIPTPGTNTKVTTNHTTGTDVVESQGEINCALAYLASAESKRKEVTPTPTLPPSPTPEATPTPERVEPVEEATIPVETSLPGEVETPQETAQPEGTITIAAASSGQIIKGAWLTTFDCRIEGNCGSHTASGTYLTEGGRFAACNTDYWPFGTKMTIVGDPNGYDWACVDVGPAIVGPAHWDVWFYDLTEGEEYLDQVGTTATIKILPP